MPGPRRLLIAFLVSVTAVALAGGCPAHRGEPRGGSAPVAAPSAAPPRIPEGCGPSLSGSYVHGEDEAYLYEGADDGGELRLDVRRRLESADGGRRALGPVVETSAFVTLRRTPQGFKGFTRGYAVSVAGRACPVDFPTEVLGCADGGLTLRAASTASLGEDCDPPERPAPVPFVTQVLRRQDAPARSILPLPDAEPGADAGQVP